MNPSDVRSVTLIMIGETESDFVWPLGNLHQVTASTQSINALLAERVILTSSEAILFWDSKLGQPDANIVSDLLGETRVDVWHAGLYLGLSGEPLFLDFVRPTWLLNVDAPPDIESSSWRLSLHACLIRTSVIHELDGPDSEFQSLMMAGLALGYRYIQAGVIIRHTPRLLNNSPDVAVLHPILDDEIRFVYSIFGRQFAYWALLRATLSGYSNPLALWRALRRVSSSVRLSRGGRVYTKNQIDLTSVQLKKNNYRVTVLIATLDRYMYLHKLLNQLGDQTIPAHEILVIDQTPVADRNTTLSDAFTDLPLKVIYLEEVGQCLSRNIGLQTATGDHILFIDDDDEIEPDLIEKHLKNLQHFCADTSSGSVDEVGALPLTEDYTLTRLSNVFPTNNTLLRRDALVQSGLFDMAFQRRQSEDGDLGIRVHLSGALMIYNPQISVLHHRAPRGGLRTHGARIITYSSSRQRLLHRRFPHVSEIYIQKRYFSARQVREASWLTIFGTFMIRGSLFRRVLKALIALVLLPDSIIKMRQRHREADALLLEYPQIPNLDSPESAE